MLFISCFHNGAGPKLAQQIVLDEQTGALHKYAKSFKRLELKRNFNAELETIRELCLVSRTSMLTAQRNRTSPRLH
jgi:hypothetical protein